MSRRDRPEPPPDTSKLPFGTISVKVGQGTWCFETEGFAWKYLEQQGNNLGLHQPNGLYTFQLHAPTLYAACMYAWGFTYGWKSFRETFKVECKEIKDAAEANKAESEKILNELKEPKL